jgi:competence protein ComEC
MRIDARILIGFLYIYAFIDSAMGRWPAYKAHFWETAPFFRVLLPFAAGIFVYYNMPQWVAYAGSFAMLAVTATVLSWLLPRNTQSLWHFICVQVAFFSAGVAVTGYNDIRSRPQWFGHSLHSNAMYVAAVAGTPQEKARTWKIPVRVLGRVTAHGVVPAPGNAFVYLQRNDAPMLYGKGDTLLLPGRWEPIQDAGNPFEFGYAAYCARNNIMHRQWCTSHDVRLHAHAADTDLPPTEQMHRWSMRQLDKYLAGHRARGLLQAMLMGDEVHLDGDLQRAYAETGIVHIIAISGGNVAVFFIVISTLLGWLRHKKYVWVKYVVAMPIVWFYVLAAGAQPSAMRAAAMFSLLAFGIIMRRNSNSLNELFATAFLLLCAEPAWLMSIGFQLSFAAVLSIILFYPYVYAWVTVHTRPGFGPNKVVRFVTGRVLMLPAKLWKVVAMSIAAEILIAPLVIYYFHTFPLMFILANAAAYLFMSFVLMQGMVMLALSGVPVIAGTIAVAIKALTDFFGSIVAVLQNAGPLALHHISMNTFETLLLYSAVADIAYFLVRRYKPALFAAAGATCILLLSLMVHEWNLMHQRRLIIYNTPHACHAEMDEGSFYTILCTDTAAQAEIQGITAPAHIGWSMWRYVATPPRQVCIVAGKTVVFADSVLPAKGSFPAHYVVVQHETDVARIKQVFAPHTIIAAGSYPRSGLAQLLQSCSEQGIDCFSVANRGAFVLAD